jgi:hypothetical protein
MKEERKTKEIEEWYRTHPTLEIEDLIHMGDVTSE